jgi:DHA2 family multidrug resistance protein-like MFS transporter
MPEQDYQKKANIALLIGAMGSFLVTVNVGIFAVLSPTLSQSFERSIGDVAILPLAFFLSQTLTFFVAGRLCDVKSTRTIFLWGFGLHFFSTLLCVFAPTLELLAGCRLIQGIATALIYVTSSVAILRSASQIKLGWALGIMSLSSGLGFIAGLSIGGYLIEFLHWRYVFAIIACLGVAPFCCTWFFYSHRARKRHFMVDLISLPLSVLAVGSLFSVLICLPRLGIGHPVVWIAALLTCLSSFVFARRCLHENNPLLSIEVLRHFPLTAALIGSSCNAMLFSGLFSPCHFI